MFITAVCFIFLIKLRWPKSKGLVVGALGLCSCAALLMKGNRRIHALRGIMGNQGKFTKKQSCKTYVFLYISVLISHFSWRRNIYCRWIHSFSTITDKSSWDTPQNTWFPWAREFFHLNFHILTPLPFPMLQPRDSVHGVYFNIEKEESGVWLSTKNMFFSSTEGRL